MTATAVDRVVLLEDHIDATTVQVDAQGSAMALRPLDGDGAKILRAFERVPHIRALRVEDLPPHFQLKGNDRISPIWLLPDEGWLVGTRANYERLKKNYPEKGFLAGDHGYDPMLPNMHGFLIAHGPAFRRGAMHGAVENVHVYNLLCAVLKVKPAVNDGDDRLAEALLRR
jgi:hypothetical protein